MTAIISGQKQVNKDIKAYLEDPVGTDFLELLDKRRLEIPDFYRLRKYLNTPELLTKTLFTPREIAYLGNNLRIFHKILRKRNACRVFLALRRSDNCYSLSRRLKITRTTVKHWLDQLMECLLIRVNDFGESNEVLFTRNYSDEHFRTIIDFIDVIAESQLKRMTVEKGKALIEGEMGFVDSMDRF